MNKNRKLTLKEKLRHEFFLLKLRIKSRFICLFRKKQERYDEFHELMPGYFLHNNVYNMKLEIWYRPLNMIVTHLKYIELYYRRFDQLNKMRDRVIKFDTDFREKLEKAFPNKENSRLSGDI